MAFKLEIKAQSDAKFHASSFGYRQGKSAHDAVAQARANCFEYKWVVDLDIKGFFDNIDHELMLKAIDKQNPPKWGRLALVRLLKVDVMYPDGSIGLGESGMAQGGVISPVLANLFLHYIFDKWMEREFPMLPFGHYAHDAIIHCASEKQAQYVLSKLKRRMFDFLGFTFRRRNANNISENQVFTGFLPEVEDKKKVAIQY